MRRGNFWGSVSYPRTRQYAEWGPGHHSSTSSATVGPLTYYNLLLWQFHLLTGWYHVVLSDMVWLLLKLLIWWDFHTQQCLEFLLRIVWKTRNIHWASLLWMEIDFTGILPDSFELTDTVLQITSLYNWGLQGRWATTVEDHVDFQSSQLRTEVWSCSGHRLSKTGQLKIGNILPGDDAGFVNLA